MDALNYGWPKTYEPRLLGAGRVPRGLVPLLCLSKTALAKLAFSLLAGFLGKRATSLG